MATAQDVARLAGTSTAVVSYVFNNGPRGVTPATRERVLRAAEQLGYHPNQVARALSAGKSHSIGLIVPDIMNSFFAEVARALEDQASGRGLLLLIGDSALDPSREDRLIETFVGRRVDALLFASLKRVPQLDQVRREGVPAVALHRLSSGVDASSISIDYESAAFTAVSHLIQSGCRRIGILNAPSDDITSQERGEGFLRAITDAGVTFDRRSAVTTRKAAYEVCYEWLASPERPDGLFAACDEQAFGVLAAAHKLGIDVPQQLAVTSIDGTEAGKYTVPSLTSVRQPVFELARRALEIALDYDPGQPAIHETLRYQLEVRDSSTVPNRHSRR